MGQRAITLRLLAATVAVPCLAGVAPPAGAFTIDARSLGMGGVLTPRDASLATANPAYLAVPRRSGDTRSVFPVPLGLAQLAMDFPSLDARSESFDILQITETLLRPPFFLELAPPDPLDGDIAITIARNAFAVDFEDARDLLPREPIRSGAIYSPPLARLGMRGAQTFVAPLVEAEARVELDDPLYEVLAHGVPLLPNSRYHLEADGTSLAGMTFHAGWSGGGWGQPQGDGLYAGAFAKYVLGLWFGTSQTSFGLATADTIFGDQDPLDVLFDAWTRTSPLGRTGDGVGVDAGVAYRAGAIDVGLGLRDISTNVWFGDTSVEHSYLDPATGAFVSETVGRNEGYWVRLPTQTMLNVSWTGRSTVLAADLVTSRWGTTAHCGGERRLGWLALRAGLLTDERRRLQVAGGLGFGLARLWLDVGLQSHSYPFTMERGWTLGTSVAIR